jgi:hypothetical protein
VETENAFSKSGTDVKCIEIDKCYSQKLMKHNFKDSDYYITFHISLEIF